MQKLDVQKKNFQMFNDIKDDDIRTWNRCSLAFNMGSKSAPLMREYLSQFGPKDKEDIVNMFNRIREHGYEATKRAIIRANSIKLHQEDENGEG